MPRQQQQQLVGLLQVIEQAVGTCRSVQSSSSNSSSTVCQGGLAGIADVQLSLTSLEEVFLNIAKQVRTLASCHQSHGWGTHATVTHTACGIVCAKHVCSCCQPLLCLSMQAMQPSWSGKY